MQPTSAELEQVIDNEQKLLDPSVRSNAEQVAELLHAEFVEFGASGKTWDRASIIEALASEPEFSGVADDFRLVALSDDAVLLTYRISGSRNSLRSSVWVRDQTAGWQLRFHQGTQVP